MARDKRNDAALIEYGWIPVHFWEKEVLKNTEECVTKVIALVNHRGIVTNK